MSQTPKIPFQQHKVWILIVTGTLGLLSLANGIFEPFDGKKTPVVTGMETKIPQVLQRRTTVRSQYDQWGRNPFLPKDFDIDGDTEFILHGIAWDTKYPKAIINDDIYAVGDKIEGKVVLEIREDRVVLKGTLRNIVLTIQEGKGT